MKNKFLPIIAAILIVIFGVVLYSSARIYNPTSSDTSSFLTSSVASSTYLKIANNLSDIGSSTVARSNLALGTMALLGNIGSSTITTLGTVTTGVWNGTVIDLGYISSSTLVTKATNYKSIQWSASYTSSTQTFDDLIFTFKNASVIDNIYVTSRDTANTVTYNFFYASNPSASTSTSYKVLASDQTVTSTPSVATNLTSFGSSTPAAGDSIRLYSKNASSSLTQWTIWFHEQ